MALQPQEPEFSRLVMVDDIGEDGLRIDFVATGEEREAVAARLGFLGLERLEGTATVERIGGREAVRLNVTFSADVLQSCVVTLDPIGSHIEQAFELLFAARGLSPGDREIEVDYEGEDPPEPLTEGALDVGEAVVEHLALAVDPYPRTPGVTLGDVLSPTRNGGPDDGPFAFLRRLVDGKGGDAK